MQVCALLLSGLKCELGALTPSLPLLSFSFAAFSFFFLPLPFLLLEVGFPKIQLRVLGRALGKPSEVCNQIWFIMSLKYAI